MKHAMAVVAAAATLCGCASNSMMPSLGGTRSAPAAIAGETFAFQPEANGEVAVRVQQVLTAGQAGFLPGDPNWIQLDIVFENTGRDTVALRQVQERLVDGRTLASASSALEVTKPPSFVGSTTTTVGLGVAGTLIGSFLFPPAALASGAAMIFMPMFQADRLQARMAELNQRSLRPGPVAPNSYISGLAFIPAVTGVSGVVVTYERNGSTRSVVLVRTNAPSAAPGPQSFEPAAGNFAPTHRIRTSATLRSAPGTGSPSIRVLRAPERVTQTGRLEGDWWEVRDQSGQTGWIYGALLAPL